MRSARGQTLVLFALTLFLGMVMIVMTLAIGDKAKAKVENQTLADVAAFSTASFTARSFNMFSVLNRAMVSHYVALLSTQALIAYATPDNPATLPLLGIAPAVMRADGWAHLQVVDIENSLRRIDAIESKLYSELKWDVIGNNHFMRTSINQSRGWPATSLWMPPGYTLGAQLACREVCHAVEDRDLNEDWDDMDLSEVAQAVLGSRGHPFPVHGVGGTEVHTHILRKRFIGGTGPMARSYRDPWFNNLRDRTNSSAAGDRDAPFFDNEHRGDPTGPNGWYFTERSSSWAAYAAVKYPRNGPGSFTVPAGGGGGKVGVVSTRGEETFDAYGAWPSVNSWVQHDSAGLHSMATPPTWYRSPWGSDIADYLDPVNNATWRISKHPGVFRGGMGLVDYKNANSNKVGASSYMTGPFPQTSEDMYGQPRIPMSLYYRQHADPTVLPWHKTFWNPLSGGANVKFGTANNGGIRDQYTVPGNAGEMDMISISTGFVYYHRHTHMPEPANMLNPFWRATLVATDMDRNGETRPLPGSLTMADYGMFAGQTHEFYWQMGWRPGDVPGLMYYGDSVLYPHEVATRTHVNLVTKANFWGVQ